MDMTNPFIWILGFVLVFWVIGGGNGFGFGNRGYDAAQVVATNNGVGNRDILDTIFASTQRLADQASGNARDTLDTIFATATQTANGITALKDQGTAQTFLLSGQINQGNKEVLERIDRYNTEGILRENANLREALQTERLEKSFNDKFCQVFQALGKKADVPPFFQAGVFPQGCEC